jgi:hypothetical protein
MDLAGQQVKVDVLEHLNPCEGFADAPHLKQHAGAPQQFFSVASSGLILPA